MKLPLLFLNCADLLADPYTIAGSISAGDPDFLCSFSHIPQLYLVFYKLKSQQSI